MENINSYIVSHGAKRIGLFHPYNELDALVFARISYLPLHKISLKKSETIGSACEKLIDVLKENDFSWPGDYEFTKSLIDANRFKDCQLSNFVRNNNRSLEKQFSAITVHIGHRKMYLSYFGTDDSIIGWKEDFNLAFLDHIPAQTAALRYLNTLTKKYPHKKMYLGGHSKGGNLAIYASTMAKDEIQKKIKRVYNYDGPGLRSGTMALDTGSEKVVGKIYSTIPQGSIIGRLFEHNESVKVVKSTAKGLYQHDIYTWQVEGTKFVKSKTTEASDLADETITKWLESATREERKVFINATFEALENAEVNNPIELRDKWLKTMPKMIKYMVKLPKEERKTVINVWTKLGKAFLRARRDKNAK